MRAHRPSHPVEGTPLSTRRSDNGAVRSVAFKKHEPSNQVVGTSDGSHDRSFRPRSRPQPRRSGPIPARTSDHIPSIQSRRREGGYRFASWTSDRPGSTRITRQPSPFRRTAVSSPAIRRQTHRCTRRRGESWQPRPTDCGEHPGQVLPTHLSHVPVANDMRDGATCTSRPSEARSGAGGRGPH